MYVCMWVLAYRQRPLFGLAVTLRALNALEISVVRSFFRDVGRRDEESVTHLTTFFENHNVLSLLTSFCIVAQHKQNETLSRRLMQLLMLWEIQTMCVRRSCQPEVVSRSCLI